MDNNIALEQEKKDENLTIVIENIEYSNDETSSETEVSERLETKGLKLKKSTKDRLNKLQSGFTDAETMISELLNQYDVFKIEGDSKYSDRKAEIDKFNYLMDSIKSSFLNSLEMASYMEEKYSEKFSSELKKKDKIIIGLQESQKELKDQLFSKEKEIENITKELDSVKDSFSRVNFALTTVEKELKDKSEIIQNSQKHLAALTEVAEDGKVFKERCDELTKTISSLHLELKQYELTNKLLSISEEDNDRYKSEITNLKEEVKNQRNYINSLNERIQDILVEKSEAITNLRDSFDESLKGLEFNKNKEIQICKDKIDKLNQEIFNLRLNNI